MMAKDASSVELKSDEKKVVKKKEKNAVPTKLVIRRLPPYLTCDDLLKEIDPLPPHDSFRFVPGDKTLAPDNFCRAYINLVSPDDLLSFRDRIDGLEITDSKGFSQPCVLEYAPFQKNPRKVKKKEDAKAGTIEEDPDYKAFLESLDEEDDKTVIDLEKYLEELEKRDQKNKCIETPLTAYLKQKKVEKKRIRDERRRAEQERKRKRGDEEKRRRDAERKKELEKARKRKEDERKAAAKKDEVDDSKSDKSEVHGKGDGKHKIKYESKGPRLSDTKPKKPDQVRRGPIGVKPRDHYGDQEEKEKDGYNDRYSYSGGRGGGSRGRGGYRGTREFTSRKWDKSDDSRKDEDGRKSEKPRNKRPDREIYRPGSGRGGARSSSTVNSSRSHKYSEQRSGQKTEDDK